MKKRERFTILSLGIIMFILFAFVGVLLGYVFEKNLFKAIKRGLPLIGIGLAMLYISVIVAIFEELLKVNKG